MVRRGAARPASSRAPWPVPLAGPGRRTAAQVAGSPARAAPRGPATRSAISRAAGFVQALRAQAEGHVVASGHRREQQVVLEHDADRALLGRQPDAGCVVLPRSARQRAHDRAEAGSSPAMTRSAVDLPAPFGPSSASTVPPGTCSCASSRHCSRSTTMCASSVTRAASGRAGRRGSPPTPRAAPGSARWPRPDCLAARGRPAAAWSAWSRDSCRRT